MVHHYICLYFVLSGLLWYLRLQAYKPVVNHLSRSYLCSNLGVLTRAAEMLVGVANSGHLQNMRCGDVTGHFV